MGKIFDAIRENLLLQIEKNTGPPVERALFYEEDGQLKVHIYPVGVKHVCDHSTCPSRDIFKHG